MDKSDDNNGTVKIISILEFMRRNSGIFLDPYNYTRI